MYINIYIFIYLICVLRGRITENVCISHTSRRRRINMEQSKYTNAVSIAVSQMDVRLIFSDSEPYIDETGKVADGEREEVAKIVMSIPLAKRFNKILTDAIADYEAKNGPIPEFKDDMPDDGHES
nr:MAG TPA: Protein of unknown function (DUF3467) [Caudoviricetes sp.]